MIRPNAPIRFDVQWSAGSHDNDGVQMWHTDTAWEKEIDAVIALGRDVEKNPDLSHRIIRTERTILFTVEGVEQ